MQRKQINKVAYRLFEGQEGGKSNLFAAGDCVIFQLIKIINTT